VFFLIFFLHLSRIAFDTKSRGVPGRPWRPFPYIYGRTHIIIFLFYIFIYYIYLFIIFFLFIFNYNAELRCTFHKLRRDKNLRPWPCSIPLFNILWGNVVPTVIIIDKFNYMKCHPPPPQRFSNFSLLWRWDIGGKPPKNGSFSAQKISLISWATDWNWKNAMVAPFIFTYMTDW